MAQASDESIALLDHVSQTPVTVSNSVNLNVNLSAYVSAAKPSSPIDGQVWVYEDTMNHVRWELVYRLADTYWYYVGGPPLFVEVLTGESVTNASYVAAATSGPAVAVPFAGDYDVGIGAAIDPATANGYGRMSYDIGGTGAVDADMIEVASTAASAVADYVSAARTRRKTGLTAVTLVAKYKTVGVSGATFANRWMTVVPVRISG